MVHPPQDTVEFQLQQQRDLLEWLERVATDFKRQSTKELKRFLREKVRSG